MLFKGGVALTNRSFICVMVVTFIGTLLTGTSVLAAPAWQRGLDAKLTDAWAQLSASLPQERVVTVAVAPIVDDQGRETLLGRIVADLLVKRMAEDPDVRTLERLRLESLLEEKQLTASDLVREDGDERREVGKLLGADDLLFGEILVTERVLTFRFRLVVVETGEVLAVSEPFTFPREPVNALLAPDPAQRIVGTWVLGANTAKTITFQADGTVTVSYDDDKSRRWRQEGDRLISTGTSGERQAILFSADDNTIRLGRSVWQRVTSDREGAPESAIRVPEGSHAAGGAPGASGGRRRARGSSDRPRPMGHVEPVARGAGELRGNQRRVRALRDRGHARPPGPGRVPGNALFQRTRGGRHPALRGPLPRPGQPPRPGDPRGPAQLPGRGPGRGSPMVARGPRH